MNSQANVIVNILVNTSGTAAGVSSFNQQMNTIASTAQRTATSAAQSFSTTFGANFFANLASSMVQSFTAGFGTLISEAVQAASKFESAFAGAGSLGQNVGLSQAETIAAIKNLDLVKNGLLNVGDAATALKNLLASGFSLDKSIELIRRFGDAAAFGRQASFTFGRSIATATEGIKNQNSILVDNVGITKNLSVILKERGFEMQDISDKVKGAAAREALYQGLLAESALQHGNAAKLLDTYQGKMVQLESAQTRFSAALGEVIIKSSLVQAALGGVVTVLDIAGRHTAAVITLTVALGGLVAATALASTGFGTLTVAQIANAAASAPVVTAIKSVIFALGNLQLVTALTVGELALLSGGLFAVAAVVGVAAYAFYQYSKTQENTVLITQAQVKVLSDQRDALNANLTVLTNAATASGGLTSESFELAQIYKSLNSESKTRADIMTEEVGKTQALTNEVNALRNARNEELEVLGRTTTAQLVDKIKQIDAQDTAIKNQIARINQLQAEANKYSALSPTDVFDTGKNSIVTAGQLATQFQNAARSAENGIAGMRTELEKAKAEGADLVGTQAAIAKSLGVTSDELTSQSVLFGTVKGSAADAQAAINAFTASQNNAKPAVVAQTDAIYDQIAALKALEAQGNISGIVAARRKIISDVQAQAAFNANGDIAAGKKAFEDAKNQVRNVNGQDITVGEIIKQQKDFETVSKALEEKASERRKRQKTETESLSDAVRKLRGEVESFQNINSKAFKIRFEREELERVRRDLEKIIDLRRELGLQLDTPLPTTAQGARTESEQLERVLRLRDSVLNVFREIQDADDKIILARLTATATVVDAQTRADTAYLTGLRERRDAEQQLTADIAAELRKRADIAADVTRNQNEIEAQAYRDFLANETNKTQQVLRDIATIKLLEGSELNSTIISAGQAIAAGAKPEQSPVLSRLDKSNELLESILKAVGGSGLSGSSEFEATVGGIKSRRFLNLTGSKTEKFNEIKAFFDSIGAVVTNGLRPTGSLIEGTRTLTKHGLGEGADIRTRDKSIEQVVADITRSIEQGLRVYDERLHVNARGVRQPHLHVEANQPKPSTFYDNRPDLYGGAENLARLKRLDAERRGIRTGTAATAQPSNATSPSAFRTAVESLGGAQFSRPEDDTIKVDGTFTQASLQAFGNVPLEEIGERAPAAIAALKAYSEAKREHNKLTAEDIVGIERVNLLTNVTITQADDLLTSEARITDFLKGDKLRTDEAINKAQIERNKAYGDALEQLVQIDDFFKRYNAGDKKLLDGIQAGIDAQRGAANKALQLEVAAAKDNASRGGRDALRERLEREKEYYTVLGEVGKAEAQLEQQRALYADRDYSDARRRSDVLNEQASIEKQLFEIENQRATSPINQALRERLATERALLAIQQDELKAGEDIATAQVQIADLTVVHQKRVEAGVLQHIAGMKSITDIYKDAKVAMIDKVWGGIDTLFDKLTSKIPFFGSILRDLLANLTKLILNPLLMKILGVGQSAPAGTTPSGTVAAPATSAGRAANVTTAIQQILSGGTSAPAVTSTTSGTAATTSTAAAPSGAGTQATLLNALLSGGDATGTPRNTLSLAGQGALGGETATAGVHEAANDSGTGSLGAATNTAATSVISATSLKGLTQSLGKMAPMLGLSLGAGLGGQSVIGQILGGVGGAAAGLAVGIGTGAIGASGGVIGGLVGALGGAAAATGILAAVAVPLLIGAWLFGRAKRRAAERKAQAQYMGDAKKQLQDILKQVRTGRMDSTTAMAQAQAIRDNYMQQAGALKSGSVRRMALAAVSELDSIIAEIKTAGQRADYAAAQDNAYVPTFDGGGMTSFARSVAMTSRNSYNDTYLARFNADTEAVLTRRDVAALGGYPALAKAGVRGASLYASNVVNQERAYQSRPSETSGGVPAMKFVIVADETTADKLVASSSGKGLIRKIKPLIVAGLDDGFTELIESKMAGEL